MRSKLLSSLLVFALALTIGLPGWPIDAVLIPATGHVLSNVASGVSSSVVSELNIPAVASFPVVQQPSGQPGYVSTSPDVVTQFSAASNFGSLGFLAHNYLAGKKFFNIKVGDKITLNYQNKETQSFTVVEVLSYQATDPTSPYSSFIDLKTGSKLTYKELFTRTYGVAGQLVLQTCIESNGNDSWGRLFIIALPAAPEAK